VTDGTVTVIDTNNFTVVETVNVGQLPLEVEAHGDRIYVTTFDGVAVITVAPSEVAVL